MAGCVDLDEEGQSERLTFPLYQNQNHEATLMSGSVKSYGMKDGGSAIYDNKKSGYSVTADRLLWVDGWEKTTFEGGMPRHQQEMTLVVLKIDLASHDAKRKFGSAKISLAFEDGNEQTPNGKNEPQVQAWAPFHSTERCNMSTAHHIKTKRREMGVKAGYSGADVSGGWSSDREISWDRTTFDQGSSTADKSRLTGRRNGVTWAIEQNERQNAGIQQTLWVAVLVSRQTPEPYLVKFQIDARIGTMEDFKNKTRTFFGSDPGKTKPFLVTPWKQKVCNYEGADILKCIDLDNLGRLRDQEKSSRLDLKWQLGHYTEMVAPVIDESANQAAKEQRDNCTEEMVSALLETPSNAPAQGPEQLSSASAASLAARLSLPPLVIGWQTPSSTPSVDVARVTALETRMAHLEARLAAHDGLMLRMQQMLLSKDIILE